MTCSRFVLVVLFLSVGFTPACGAGSAPSQSTPQARSSAGSATTAQAIQARIEAWLVEPGHRGVSAAVIQSDGSSWAGAAGQASTGEALRPDHQIAIGSITKTVTAALILQLSQEQRLNLDDTVGAWLGGLSNVPPQITLRQLLNHTSGLADYTLHPAFEATLAADAARRFTPQDVLALFMRPPDFVPGERTQYTNTAFLLLGLVAERAVGREIAAQWRERFWGPLGLDEVFLPPDERARGSVAHAWVGGSAVTMRETDPSDNVAGFSTRWAAFGLMASPRNVARWGRALFAGPVLDAATRQQMLTFGPPGGNIAIETGSGLGVRRYQYGGREQWGHTGAAAEGSSMLVFSPSSGITVAVAMNQSPATHASSHFALAGDLLGLAGDAGR